MKGSRNGHDAVVKVLLETGSVVGLRSEGGQVLAETVIKGLIETGKAGQL